MAKLPVLLELHW